MYTCIQSFYLEDTYIYYWIYILSWIYFKHYIHFDIEDTFIIPAAQVRGRERDTKT